MDVTGNPPDLMAPAGTSGAFSAKGEAAPAAHLEAALESAIAAEPGAAAAAAPPAPLLMPRDKWCDLYLKVHGIAGQALGSQVLAGVPNRAGGLEAAGAIYDTCAEVPWLHFLLSPSSIWFQRAAVVLFFYAPIVGELRAERARRLAPARPPAPRETAADPATVYPREIHDGGLAMPPGGAQ